MKPYLIGITGGSGSGKTALAVELRRRLGGNTGVFHLDNYQRFGQRLPMVRGIKNWDHPRSVDWGKFRRDLDKLKKGHHITIKFREQKELKKVFTKVFKPTKFLIVEGYMLLLKPAIRDLLDFTIYLHARDHIRISRRTKFKNDKYVKNVLLPMHNKYIEPTKRFADIVLNTEKDSISHNARVILRRLNKNF